MLNLMNFKLGTAKDVHRTHTQPVPAKNSKLGTQYVLFVQDRIWLKIVNFVMTPLRPGVVTVKKTTRYGTHNVP